MDNIFRHWCAEGGGAGLGSLSGSFGNCIKVVLILKLQLRFNRKRGFRVVLIYRCRRNSSYNHYGNSYGDGWTGNAVGFAGPSDTSSFTLLSVLLKLLLVVSI